MRQKAKKTPVYNLEERLLDFAARIVRFTEKLPATRAGSHIANQLLRSGTSPLPNHGEAQAAESRKDFIHKMRVAHKELRETHRWLRLCRRVPLLKEPQKLDELTQETDELIAIFYTSIRTAKARRKPRN
ncbi:MAG: four helix bundle protein [Planctomycetota bacterium]